MINTKDVKNCKQISEDRNVLPLGESPKEPFITRTGVNDVT